MILPLGRVATLVFLFVSAAGSLFCSTFTSASCSVTVGTQTSSMTDPSYCGVGSGSGASYAIASVAAYIDTATVYLDAGVNVYTDAQNITATATAVASANQEFRSAGVPRMGFITIYGDCSAIYGIPQGFDDYCLGSIIFRDGIHTVDGGELQCFAQNLCQSITVPFELGTIFSIDASATNSSSNTNGIMYNDEPSISYVLSDQNGPVTVSMVPEPTPAVLVGMALLALAPLARLRKYSLLSRLL